MQKTVKRKSEGLPDLEEALDDATSRFEEAHKAREQRHKANDLKQELAWAHVASKEAELQTSLADAARLAKRLPKIREDMQGAQVGCAYLGAATIGVHDVRTGKGRRGVQPDRRTGSRVRGDGGY